MTALQFCYLKPFRRHDGIIHIQKSVFSCELLMIKLICPNSFIPTLLFIITHIHGLVKCFKQKKITTLEKSVISRNLQNFKLKWFNQSKNKFITSRGNNFNAKSFFTLFSFTNPHLFFPIKYGNNSLVYPSNDKVSKVELPVRVNYNCVNRPILVFR